MQLRVLSVSDRVEEVIYSPNLRQRFKNIDFAISCGDLPYYYVEYIVSMLDKPVFFVRGNHAKILELDDQGIPILVAACSGAAVYIVLPEKKLQEASL